MNPKLYISLIIAILALYIGYPMGGAAFILMMAPYAIYMVWKSDAAYLPALAIHAASETSITTAIFVTFIFIAIRDYKKYAPAIKLIFWLLMGILPLIVTLVFQRWQIAGDYLPIALNYAGNYLSFFAFFYGLAVCKTFSRATATALIYATYGLFIINLLGPTYFIRLTTIAGFVSCALLIAWGSGKMKMSGIVMLSAPVVIAQLAKSYESTFTTLFIMIFCALIVYMYYKNRVRSLKLATGILPFIIIVILYYYGISNYLTMNIMGQTDIEGIDLTSFENFTQRIEWKLFADRAPFWAGAWNQILQYQHWLPMYNIPDISVVTITRQESEVSFGAHTTILALLRNYGLITGGVLTFCYIKLTLLTKNIFSVKQIDPVILSTFAVAMASVIIVCLTGTYAMMVNYAIVSFGLMGVAYNKYRQSL